MQTGMDEVIRDSREGGYSLSPYRSHMVGCLLCAVLVYVSANSYARWQIIESPASPGPFLAADNNRQAPDAAFSGHWLYRSFLSDPKLSDPDAPLKTLLFGQGNLVLAVAPNGTVTGTLGGQGWQLQLAGTAHAGNPSVIRFRGEGTIGGEKWIYGYLGYSVPSWPESVDQRPAIVGTIDFRKPLNNQEQPFQMEVICGVK